MATVLFTIVCVDVFRQEIQWTKYCSIHLSTKLVIASAVVTPTQVKKTSLFDFFELDDVWLFDGQTWRSEKKLGWIPFIFGRRRNSKLHTGESVHTSAKEDDQVFSCTFSWKAKMFSCISKRRKLLLKRVGSLRCTLSHAPWKKKTQAARPKKVEKEDARHCGVHWE